MKQLILLTLISCGIQEPYSTVHHTPDECRAEKAGNEEAPPHRTSIQQRRKRTMWAYRHIFAPRTIIGGGVRISSAAI